MNVAERFESIRTMLRLNRGQFAAFLGITGSLVGCMEKGTAAVSRKTTARLTERLGINPVWLQYGEGDMFIRSDISLDTLLDANPALKALYDARVEKELSVKRKAEERVEKAAVRLARHKEAAERLRLFREYAGLNQNQLAKRLGVTRALISAIEKEKNLISVPMAQQIQSLFGVSADWLLYGTGEMVPADDFAQIRPSVHQGHLMIGRMVSALTDMMKAGDWENLNAAYSLLVDDQIQEHDEHCELVAV